MRNGNLLASSSLDISPHCIFGPIRLPQGVSLLKSKAKIPTYSKFLILIFILGAVCANANSPIRFTFLGITISSKDLQPIKALFPIHSKVEGNSISVRSSCQ